MQRELIAFVSLGLCCGGPEKGKYGKFVVDLSEDEWEIIDAIASDGSIKGYKRYELEEKYPGIDEKIRLAGQALVERASLEEIIAYNRQYVDLPSLIKEDVASGHFQWDAPVDIRNMRAYEHLLEVWEKWETPWILSKPSYERFELVKSRYQLMDGVTVYDVCGELCYYLSDKEIPKDYNK